MTPKIQHRINDPSNYKEACYYIASHSMGLDQLEYLEDMNSIETLTWLGSNCGQYFIREANKLIEEYPFKEDCNFAIICGKVNVPEVFEGHKKWIEEKLWKQIKREKQ